MTRRIGDRWVGVTRLIDTVRRDGRFSPGRRLLLAGAAVAGAGLGWLGWRRRTVYDLETVVTAICDRILPPHGEHPGAVALDIHRTVLDELRDTRGDDHLDALVSLMHAHDFLDLAPAARDEVIARLLDRDRDRADAAMIGNILRRSVNQYLTHPGAWPALGYAKPQPLGYPDYASCPPERSA